MEYQNDQIAIDGPAASGKSTVARHLAQRLNACYVNTGEMYRTLTWVVLQKGLDPQQESARIAALLPNLDIVYKPDRDGRLHLMLDDAPVEPSQIRAPDVTAHVSAVSRIPEVREWMVERQRASSQYGLIVMEGRDIGTVVLPHARHKFFITATPMERARRRLAQAGEVADGATLESVAADIAERDRIDSSREISPLRPADDAVIIDTTELSIEAVIDHVTSLIEKHR